MSDSDDLARILCVDDEPGVLDGLRRVLFEHFDVTTVQSGAEGLEALDAQGPFAVVMSDMRMPEMNGAEFLARVRRAAPDTVRVLLTGQADLEAAIAAVNDGNIFRFLSKPCPQDILVRSLRDAVKQHRLILAERELLENTLKGSLKVLTEVLSLASPVAFSRSGYVKNYVTHMADRLDLDDKWQVEVAAMLSQIGCIALPPSTLERIYAGQDVSGEEQRMYEAHPETGYRLLANIPRLEGVAEMIRYQHDPAGGNGVSDSVRLGARMLRVALDVDRLVRDGLPVKEATEKLKRQGRDDAELLDALDGFQGEERCAVVRAVRVRKLGPHMILDEDVEANNGMVLLRKGHELNGVLIERLKSFALGIGVKEPIRVRIPT